jgi:hypothetical protein
MVSKHKHKRKLKPQRNRNRGRQYQHKKRAFNRHSSLMVTPANVDQNNPKSSPIIGSLVPNEEEAPSGEEA